MTPHHSRTSVRLSKSRFLSGLQCSKRLYFEVHQPELAGVIDPERQAIMDMGTEVGVIARRRFLGGVLVEESYRQPTAALRRTADLIQDPTTMAIFEGAFEWQDTMVRVDILERVTPDSWRLIEVKSTSKVKRTHLNDVAVQAEVVSGAGIALAEVGLMHLNTHYIYQGGELDLDALFVLTDLTESVLGKRSHVGQEIERMRQVLRSPSLPVVNPGSHCHRPYSCPFWGNCTKDKPPRWIYHLPGSREVFRDLDARGIELIDDIPEDVPLTILQQRMKDNVEWISPELCTILRDVEFPVHHLDFETFMPAIPLYAGTRPYRPIPIQWSNHIEQEDGTIQHEAYLCTDPKDPREEVANTVLATLGDSGTICVYSDNERQILLALAEVCPALRERLNSVVERLWDLFLVLQNHYYHPEFHGSLSIKAVLPSLVPSMAYDHLDVPNGAMASVVYRKMVFEEQDLIERSRMANALREYCGQDTLGMLELRRVLLDKTSHLGYVNEV